MHVAPSLYLSVNPCMIWPSRTLASCSNPMSQIADKDVQACSLTRHSRAQGLRGYTSQQTGRPVEGSIACGVVPPLGLGHIEATEPATWVAQVEVASPTGAGQGRGLARLAVATLGLSKGRDPLPARSGLCVKLSTTKTFSLRASRVVPPAATKLRCQLGGLRQTRIVPSNPERPDDS